MSRNSTRKPGRRSKPRLPAAVRKDIIRLASELNRQHALLFKADPKLKDRASRLLRSLLLPKPKRRGRPGIPSVTQALALLKKYRRQYPTERPDLLWERIYSEAISNYASMNPVEQSHARQVLRERVRWRRRKRKPEALLRPEL